MRLRRLHARFAYRRSLQCIEFEIGNGLTGTSRLRTNRSASAGLLAKGGINSSACQGQGHSDQNRQLIFVQRVGGINRRAEAAAGTIFALRRASFCRTALAGGARTFLAGLERAFP